MSSPAAKPPDRFPAPSRPSLAVLPFVNLGGGPDQDDLAFGVWFDLNAELVKLAGLFLLNGTSTSTLAGREVDASEPAVVAGSHAEHAGLGEVDLPPVRVPADDAHFGIVRVAVRQRYGDFVGIGGVPESRAAAREQAGCDQAKAA